MPCITEMQDFSGRTPRSSSTRTKNGGPSADSTRLALRIYPCSLEENQPRFDGSESALHRCLSKTVVRAMSLREVRELLPKHRDDGARTVRMVRHRQCPRNSSRDRVYPRPPDDFCRVACLRWTYASFATRFHANRLVKSCELLLQQSGST